MKLLILILFLLSAGNSSIAQNGNHPKIDEYEIDSKIFEGKRLVSVSTPVGYSAKDTQTTYLVAYLFDGQFTPYFNIVNSTIQYYSQLGDGVPMIVISIHTTDRSTEFTPAPNDKKTIEGWEGRCGQADKLTAFIREEVIPQVEKKYNVKPYRLGIGHSLGGTYVMTEILKKESLFNSVIAVSPNMVYDNEQVVEQGKTYFKEAPNSHAFIYCSAGDQGKMENSFRTSLEKLNEDAKINAPKTMTWEYEYLKGDSHMSTFLPTFDNGYLKFSEKWRMTEIQEDDIANSENPLASFQEFYKNISLFAGYTYKPNSDDYNNFAYSLDYFEKQKEAIKVLDKAILLFPMDANLHDSKGEMLEKLGEETLANKSYATALKILKQNKSNYDQETYDYYLEMFTKNIGRTSKK
jgi:predicted alpha/beta superfamily hydrolase